MPITLITGLPGHGKSLNAIKFVDTEFKERQVFYNGIKGLTLDWTELDKPEDWYNCPSGSVIVLDECQRVFPVRAPGRPVPIHVSEFETHRHKGLDVVLVTQHPNLIDSHVRRLVDQHIHYVRQFGMNASTQYKGTSGVWDFNNYHDKKNAIKSRVKLDKKYFNVYKSAEVHTVKRKIPLKVFIPVILFLFVFGLFTKLFFSAEEWVSGDKSEALTGGGDNKDVSPSFSSSSSVFKGSSNDDLPIEQAIVPRVEGFAFTAPIYDELRKPKSYPWPNCISASITGCRCYSQQGTRMDVPKDQCERIIKNGLFDYAKEDKREDSEPVDVIQVHLRAAAIYESMRDIKQNDRQYN